MQIKKPDVPHLWDVRLVVYVLPPKFRNDKHSFPSFQIRRIYRIYLSPDNAGDAASGTGASARSPRFSQTHSPDSVYIGIPPPPTLCATVLPATYFCSWNLTAFSIRESTGFVKAFCKTFANFIILHSFNSLLQIRIHKSESVSAYPCC